MTKFLLNMSVMSCVLAMAQAFVPESAQAQYAYACKCITDSKICEGIENLHLLLEDEGGLLGDIGSEDWEFNTSLEAKLSKKSAPKRYVRYFSRYTIISARSYLPESFKRSELLIMHAMQEGDVRPTGKIRLGKAVVINPKGTPLLEYACKAIEVDNF